MKKTTLAVAALLLGGSVMAQEVNSGSSSSSAAITSASSTSLSGGSAINANNTAGNVFSATIQVNNPDPNAGGTLSPQSTGATLGSSGNPMTSKTEVKTVGNPAAMSLATSFSQYNCANSAGAGAGWMGGVFSIGGAVESGPCNARANAAALVSLASVLPAEDPMKRQLVDAAIRLIGESTMATENALKASNVGFFAPVAKTKSDLPIPAFDKPGVYVGSDPIVLQRIGAPQVAADPTPTPLK